MDNKTTYFERTLSHNKILLNGHIVYVSLHNFLRKKFFVRNTVILYVYTWCLLIKP